jgi:hypothetical protein
MVFWQEVFLVWCSWNRFTYLFQASWSSSYNCPIGSIIYQYIKTNLSKKASSFWSATPLRCPVFFFLEFSLEFMNNFLGRPGWTVIFEQLVTSMSSVVLYWGSLNSQLTSWHTVLQIYLSFDWYFPPFVEIAVKCTNLLYLFWWEIRWAVVRYP